jgi:hypothetical protein
MRRDNLLPTMAVAAVLNSLKTTHQIAPGLYAAVALLDRVVT